MKIFVRLTLVAVLLVLAGQGRNVGEGRQEEEEGGSHSKAFGKLTQ